MAPPARPNEAAPSPLPTNGAAGAPPEDAHRERAPAPSRPTAPTLPGGERNGEHAAPSGVGGEEAGQSDPHGGAPAVRAGAYLPGIPSWLWKLMDVGRGLTECSKNVRKVAKMAPHAIKTPLGRIENS